MPHFAAWEPLQESPPHPPHPCTRGSPRSVAVKAASYLRRLGKGMEPEPEPRIFFFPLNNFSTRATFPVRAASRSSCSFPIPDTSLQRQDDKNPTALPYIPVPSLPLFQRAGRWSISLRRRCCSAVLLMLQRGLDVLSNLSPFTPGTSTGARPLPRWSPLGEERSRKRRKHP